MSCFDPCKKNKNRITVRIYADIASALFVLNRDKHPKASNPFSAFTLYRAWTIARTSDILGNNGSGWVDPDFARAMERTYGVRWRAMKKHPLVNTFFEFKSNGYIEYKSAKHVADTLGNLANMYVRSDENIAEVDYAVALRGGLFEFKATCYAVVTDGLTVSRRKLREMFGVSKSQQIRYEKYFGTEVQSNIATYKFRDNEHLQDVLAQIPDIEWNGDNPQITIDYQNHLVFHRLPNTYKGKKICWKRRRRRAVPTKGTGATRADAVFFSKHGLVDRRLNHKWIPGKPALLYAGTNRNGTKFWLHSTDSPSRGKNSVRFGGVARSDFSEIQNALRLSA